MLTAFVLAVAMTGQAPPKPAAAPAKPPASALAPAAKPAAVRPSPGSGTAADERARLIAKRRARKAKAYAARVDREAKADAAEARAIKEAKAEFERTLPARLELNRQLLQRQTDVERNALMNRAVGAMERRAGYVYPGQSPMRGPF